MGYKSQLRRCTATSKSTGEPCKAYACRDAFVCQKHGGLAPQVQGKASERRDQIQITALERMEALVPDAVQAMHDVIRDPNAKAADRINAANGILDRFVAKKVHAEIEDNREERDIDAEIAAALNDEQETG